MTTKKTAPKKAAEKKVAEKKVASIETSGDNTETTAQSAPRHGDLTAFVRGLILAGKSNVSIRSMMCDRFGLDPEGSKRSFPAWLRCHMVRRGEITKEFAKANK